MNIYFLPYKIDYLHTFGEYIHNPVSKIFSTCLNYYNILSYFIHTLA